MDMVNCPRCGKLFSRVKSPICPSCEKEEEQTFQQIRQFIDDNENCTLSELSKGTGVSQKKILRYIHEGRLEISKGMRGDVRCKICSRPITKGQYCDACLIKINQNIYDVFTQINEQKKQVSTMHIDEKSHK